MHWLRLDRIPPEKQAMRAKAKRALLRFTGAAIDTLREDDEEFLQGGRARALVYDWVWAVGRQLHHCSCVTALASLQLHHCLPAHLHPMQAPRPPVLTRHDLTALHWPPGPAGANWEAVSQYVDVSNALKKFDPPPPPPGSAGGAAAGGGGKGGGGGGQPDEPGTGWQQQGGGQTCVAESCCSHGCMLPAHAHPPTHPQTSLPCLPPAVGEASTQRKSFMGRMADLLRAPLRRSRFRASAAAATAAEAGGPVQETAAAAGEATEVATSARSLRHAGSAGATTSGGSGFLGTLMRASSFHHLSGSGTDGKDRSRRGDSSRRLGRKSSGARLEGKPGSRKRTVGFAGADDSDNGSKRGGSSGIESGECFREGRVVFLLRARVLPPPTPADPRQLSSLPLCPYLARLCVRLCVPSPGC
jgi:hypothetical protein